MISVVIITKNEEENIERCLKSVVWADEIIILDSGSTDNTIDICRKFNCKVVESEWLGFGKTKNLAVSKSRNNWILSIDADEEVSNDLKKSLEGFTYQKKYYAYRVKRKSFYLNKLINYSGWQNDCPIRFFNKKYANFNSLEVHESVITDDKRISFIDGHLLHFPYPSIEQHIKKINLYSQLGSKKLLQDNKKVYLLSSVFSGIFKFIKMYFLKLGFLDGKEGFVLCLISSFGVSLKYFKLWSFLRKK